VTALALLVSFSAPARADFTACNQARAPIFVSIAYEEKDKGLVSLGWWELQREACEVLITGSLQGRKIWTHTLGRNATGGWWIWWPNDPKVANIEKLCTTEPSPSNFTIYKNQIRGTCKDAGFVERPFRLASGGNAARPAARRRGGAHAKAEGALLGV
jgi:hypothetical protein